VRLFGRFLRDFAPAFETLGFLLPVVLDNRPLRAERHECGGADLRPLLDDELHLVAFRQALGDDDRPCRFSR